MSEKDPFLSVYGHVTIDQIIFIKDFPTLNESVDVISKKTTLGGTGTNIAVTAAKLGVPTALCSFVGEDFPAQYEEQIRDSGLMLDDFVRVKEYESSQALVFNNQKMEQKVIFYQGPQGHASDLNNKLLSSAKRSKHVHFCTGEPEYYIDLMNDLRSADRMIAVDPAQEIYKMWDTQKMESAVKRSNYIFCNEFEAKFVEKYLGMDDLMSLDMEMVVRTEGEKGSTVKVNGEIIKVPAVKSEKFMDATGAGDAFRAGYYAGIYYGYDQRDALILAATTSSFIIESIGALTSVPTWESVLKRGKEYL